jgi:hypothetical protein
MNERGRDLGLADDDQVRAEQRQVGFKDDIK